VVAGALLGASLYFYQASWFVPIFAAATEFAVPGLWHRPGRRRIGLFVGITALVVLLPGLLALRGGLSDVTAQTLDRAVWNRWDERGGDSALIVLPEEVDKASVAEFRTRFGDDELRVATSQSTGDRDVLLLQGPRRRVEPAVVAAEDQAWTVLRTPWVSYSIAGRGLQMLRQLFYAPSPESSGRWVDAPLLNPLIAPLFVLGLVEALRRRREPIVRMLLVWTVCAAFVPAVVGGVVPRRAVLMLPFAWALMVLPLREIGAAVVGRGPRALLAALGVAFLAAVVATDAHLYFRNWDQRFAVQIGGREVLELAKVVKALPPEEVVIVPGLYRDYQLYALESRVLGRSGAVIVATEATTPRRVAEVSCRQTIPFTWATLDTPKHHERFRSLENDFVYRVEPAGIFRMLRVVVRKQHACETRP
jgi:hypothetical protein